MQTSENDWAREVNGQPLQTEFDMAAPARLESVVRGGRRIVIADDNVDALESLAMLLSLDGHEVYQARDGEAAFRLVELLRPELALLDIGMPRMNGYEVARRIRGIQGFENIRLVALTGWGQDTDRKRAQDAGFDAHLTKPVDLERLGSLLADSAAPDV